MPQYEASPFDPPAPVIRALVCGPTNVTIPDVPMLIDTGADISLIPLNVADAVRAIVQPSNVLIQFYTGNAIAFDQAEVSIEFFRYRFRGSFLVAESSYGILGRNILNLLVVTLDGPKLTWRA